MIASASIRHGKPHVSTPLYRYVAVTSVRLQKRDRCDHRRYNQHSRQRVRQHLFHDLFRLLRQAVVRTQRPNLLLQRGMATELDNL